MICLLTDFGMQDGYVGVMKGVIKDISPDMPIIDLSHHIPPQDVSAAAFVLWNSYKYFPKRTVFVCVVDPGVGTDRKIVIVQARDYFFIAPDNGVLDLVVADTVVEKIVEVNNEFYMRSEISHTFHGRDIFSPVGAHLANGIEVSNFGPERKLNSPIPSTFIEGNLASSQPILGKIIYIDHFGNLVSNIKLADDYKGQVAIHSTGQFYDLKITYGEVAKGEVLALKGSHGLLELAVNGGNAQEILQIGVSEKIQLTLFT